MEVMIGAAEGWKRSWLATHPRSAMVVCVLASLVAHAAGAGVLRVLEAPRSPVIRLEPLSDSEGELIIAGFDEPEPEPASGSVSLLVPAERLMAPPVEPLAPPPGVVEPMEPASPEEPEIALEPEPRPAPATPPAREEPRALAPPGPPATGGVEVAEGAGEVPQPEAGLVRPPRAVSFAGLTGERARKVVYVVDGSAAMVSTLRWAKQQLRESIGKLDETQTFQVIVAREKPDGSDDTRAFESRLGTGMVYPTNPNQQELRRWLDAVEPGGRSNPLVGLRAALALEPDLVFIITRSIRRSGNAAWGAGSEETLRELDRLNPVHPSTRQRRVVIKAIQLVEDDPTGLLRNIAQAHGDGEGSYRVIPLEQLAK